MIDLLRKDFFLKKREKEERFKLQLIKQMRVEADDKLDEVLKEVEKMQKEGKEPTIKLRMGKLSRGGGSCAEAGSHIGN